MKLTKITTCLLIFSSPLYAQQDMDVEKLEDMLVSTPFVESVDDLAHPMTSLSHDELRNKIGATLAKRCKMNWA